MTEEIKNMLAQTPTPPYYAVIFSSIMNKELEGYHEMANAMVELAEQQAGFLGMESAREEVGITVSYWRSLSDIHSWQQNSKHLAAQKLGRSVWYKDFTVRISKVEKCYGFSS